MLFKFNVLFHIGKVSGLVARFELRYIKAPPLIRLNVYNSFKQGRIYNTFE